MPPLRTRLALALALLATGAGVIAITATSAAQTSTRASTRHGGRVDRALVRHFAIFRGARAASLPAADASVASRLAHFPAGQQLGLIPAQAVSVRVNPTETVLVIPGTSGACAVETVGPLAGGFAGCAQSAALVGGRPLLAGSTGGGQTAYIGLAPDGATHESVPLTDGGTASAPVVSNVYTLTVPGATSAP
jgi:hypothetical protein